MPAIIDCSTRPLRLSEKRQNTFRIYSFRDTSGRERRWTDLSVRWPWRWTGRRAVLGTCNVLQYIYSHPLTRRKHPNVTYFLVLFSCGPHHGRGPKKKKWGNGIISEIESTLTRFSCQTLVTGITLPPSHHPRAATEFSCMTCSIVPPPPPP